MSDTPRTDAMLATDLHHLDDDQTCPAAVYWRMATLGREIERELSDAKQETFKVTHQIRNWLDEIPSSWGELGEIPISIMVGHALQEENKTMRKYLNESEENQERISVLERELADAREQRDRLADTLIEIDSLLKFAENNTHGDGSDDAYVARIVIQKALISVKGEQL